MGIKMENKFVIQHNKALLFQGCILAVLGVTGPVLIPEQDDALNGSKIPPGGKIF